MSTASGNIIADTDELQRHGFGPVAQAVKLARSEAFEANRNAQLEELAESTRSLLGIVRRARLEELRAALRAESISYGELAELADLVPFIEAGDMELLEAAGVPEHACANCRGAGFIETEEAGARCTECDGSGEGS